MAASVRLITQAGAWQCFK